MVPPLAAPPNALSSMKYQSCRLRLTNGPQPQRRGLGLTQIRVGKIAGAGAAGREQQVPAHLAVAVRQAIGVTRPGRIQQQSTGFHRLAGHHVDARSHPLRERIIVYW